MNIHEKIENIITALDTDSYNDKARAIEEILEVIGQWGVEMVADDYVRAYDYDEDYTTAKEEVSERMKKSLEKEAKAE